VFGGGLTFSSLVFYSATLLSVLLLKGSSRRFLVGWYVCVFAIFLNPLLSGMIAEHLTSANAFWRLVYILPFPLVIGIPAVALCEARLTSARHAYFLLIFLIVATMLVNTIPSDFGVFKKVEFGVFRYKIDKKIGLDAKRMADNIPDGPMLAPLRYSSIIPMFTPGLPQIAVRGFELKHFAGIHGRPKVARERLKAVAFVSGSNNKGFEAFVEVLKMGLKTVVLDSSMVGSIKARQVLLENGFTLFDEGDSYIIYVRR
jgi:MFS family permease